MNYTKTIREYCLQNKGTIFDVSYMRAHYFEMVPYKTLLKILNRLEAEGIVTTVSKGVYKINGGENGAEDSIIDRYIADGHGMIVGYALYNELGITDFKSDTIEVYTRYLAVEHKTIGQYYLTKVELPFPEKVVSIVSLLECIENVHKINDVNIVKWQETVEKLADSYDDEQFKIIITELPYHYSTAVTLAELLDRKKIKNNCIKIYERCQAK